MVCGVFTSRIEVGSELINQLNLKDRIKINEVNSSYYAKEYFAERPSNERLVNKRLNELDLNIMRDWKIALKDYLQNYYKDYLQNNKYKSIV